MKPRSLVFRQSATVPCVATLIALTSLGADAVVIRHDRSGADSLKLAERFAAVGRVLPDGGCTLVAPTWAITAAHVAASLGPGAQVAFGDRTVDVKRAVLHPEGTAQRGVPPEVDLALLELGAPVRGVTPLPLYRGRDELGATLVIVGYGDFGSPGAPLQRTDGRRRAASNVVVDAGPRRLFMKFDAPPAGVDLEGVGGPGDSGGPALIDVGGVWHVAGVSSASMDGRPGQYGVTDVYTRASSYAEWISNTISK
jgi:hypothetical protein